MSAILSQTQCVKIMEGNATTPKVLLQLDKLQTCFPIVESHFFNKSIKIIPARMYYVSMETAPPGTHRF